MILTTLAELPRYASLHPLFAPAFAWLASDAHRGLAPGRYPLRGEELFVNVDEGITRAPAACRFESHRRFIDVQVPGAGGELMEWAPVPLLELEQDYLPERDIAFYRDPAGPVSRACVRPLQVAVFFPEDAHKPCICLEQPAPFRKLVVKVREQV